MSRILIVEDDRAITDNLKRFLQKEGYDSYAVPGQKEAESALEKEKFDLSLVDISLENGNGFSVCHMMKENYQIPVIFLTASGDEYSLEAGFNAGADDYVAKPFRPRELLSRIKHALRAHRAGNNDNLLEYGGVVLDQTKAMVYKDGNEIFLSALEYRLLLIFFNHMGKVLSRNQILAEIWDTAGDYVNDNTLTVYIKRLRLKIEDDPGNPTIIKTVRGMGYKAGESYDVE